MSYYSNQYGTQQTSAQNVPQQQQQQQRRQSASQPRYQTSTSAQVSSRSEYPEQSGTTSPISPNNRTDVLIPKSPYTPHITTGLLKLSRRTSTLTAQAMRLGTLLSQSRSRLPPAVLTSNAAPLGSQQLNTPPPAVPSNAAPPDNQQPTTLYAPSSSSVQHGHTERPPAHYPVPQSYTGQSTPYYPPTHAFDSSYPGPQLPPTFPHVVPHGHGTNASDGSRSSNHYPTAAPLTRVAPDPLYRGTQPQGGVAQPQYRDADEYDNVDERRPKSPSGGGPVQGRRCQSATNPCSLIDNSMNFGSGAVHDIYMALSMAAVAFVARPTVRAGGSAMVFRPIWLRGEFPDLIEKNMSKSPRVHNERSDSLTWSSSGLVSKQRDSTPRVSYLIFLEKGAKILSSPAARRRTCVKLSAFQAREAGCQLLEALEASGSGEELLRLCHPAAAPPQRVLNAHQEATVFVRLIPEEKRDFDDLRGLRRN
ncbi:hypothetical protein EDB85DRAFT_1896131 [Lactarius pseudohatsudake]|nr:hypothetical protein EDB85DRAFT_1896131 [Lactarius pseudohatsudake]